MAKFSVGDSVRIKNVGSKYSSYYSFFEENDAPYDIAARFSHENYPKDNYFKDEEFVVVFVGSHISDDCTIYAVCKKSDLENGPVFLFGGRGLAYFAEKTYRVPVNVDFLVDVKTGSENSAEDIAVRTICDELDHSTVLRKWLDSIDVYAEIKEVDAIE